MGTADDVRAVSEIPHGEPVGCGNASDGLRKSFLISAARTADNKKGKPMTPRYVVKYNKYQKLSLVGGFPGGYYIYDNQEHTIHSRWSSFDAAVDYSLELNERRG